ncbi:NADPH-dependent aldehyde reductase Ahr [Allorhodopirellula heiligendammensis]|uniref:alcohol dehydrogenase (NADP(+)) n=1 Tax=Allorhodopirellula heiligendammensis TaxID=2714739 RepID=A0A5C6BDP6_9BACT|nr:NAD(P)-dependent alcohol dehydrogenase [Allorhodopirellula heiligendammensis]TWU09757.1 Aldehyde reductase Ahr [Allorhodopirellula heiligendammensis]
MDYQAWVAAEPGAPFQKQSMNRPSLGLEEVEVEVEHCGVCHSDLSMWQNEWGIAAYPAVLGHEVVGRVTALGAHAKALAVGQRVGIGWNSGSCMHCRPCMSGDQHLCNEAQPTIAGHFGGFAKSVRAHWAWTIPLPEGLNIADAGPLLCGGITVFNPIAKFATPMSRVGVIGIGGLGHMAVKFASAYGCDVTAFTSRESKFDEARGFGAQHVVATRDSQAVHKLEKSFDLLIVTVNVPLDWDALIASLAPNGRMHVVGAVLDPIPVSVFPLIMRQASVGASPTGSPVGMADMLQFAARHDIAPQAEHFPMSKINEAFEHVAAGNARYRVVLDADF